MGYDKYFNKPCFPGCGPMGCPSACLFVCFGSSVFLFASVHTYNFYILFPLITTFIWQTNFLHSFFEMPPRAFFFQWKLTLNKAMKLVEAGESWWKMKAQRLPSFGSFRCKKSIMSLTFWRMRHLCCCARTEAHFWTKISFSTFLWLS